MNRQHCTTRKRRMRIVENDFGHCYPRFTVQEKDRSGKDTWITVSEHHTKTQARERVRWIKKWKPELI